MVLRRVDDRLDRTLPGFGLLPPESSLLGRPFLADSADLGNVRVAVRVVANLQAISAGGRAVQAEPAVAADAGLAADHVLPHDLCTISKSRCRCWADGLATGPSPLRGSPRARPSPIEQLDVEVL